MSKSLKDIEWKEFKLSSLFIFKKGNCSNSNILADGSVPYIGATNRMNGVLRFVSSNTVTAGNCIVFIGAGDGSAGYAIYKKEDFICSSSNICGYNDKLNRNIGLFITTCSDINQAKYSHGYSRNMQRLKKDYIMLPINSKGEPDYEFMEEYIKEKENKLKQEYKNYIQKRVQKLEEKIEDKREWKDFYVDEIFNIKSGVRLTKANMKKGNIPFISATDSNNGITNWVNNKNNSTDKNVLGVNYNGSVVETFYHPYLCTFSDDVKRFTTKNINSDKHINLFLKNSILKQKCKYMYGYKFNEKRMKKQKIMLPINSNNKPDYEYMHNYMLYLEQKKILEYLEYIK